MAIVLQQVGSATNGGGVTTTRTLVLTPTGASNLLVLGVLVYTSVGAGGGNGTIVMPPSGWTLHPSAPISFHTTTNLYFYYYENNPGSIALVSLGVDNANVSTIILFGEYSGVATSGSLDSTTSNTQTGNTGSTPPITGNPLTTNTAYTSSNTNDVFVVFAGDIGDSAFNTFTGGYTNEKTSTITNNGDVVNNILTYEDKIVSAAGTNTFTCKGTTNKDYGTFIQAFKQAGSQSPFVPIDQPNPTRLFVFPNVGFAKGLDMKFVGPPDSLPVLNYDFPNPRGAQGAVDLRTWLQTTDMQYGPLDTGPFKPYDFPNPRAYARSVELLTWLQNEQIDLIKPFAQTEWPNPRGGVTLKPNGAVYNGTILLPAPNLTPPPYTYDYPNPKGAGRSVDLLTWVQDNTIVLPPPNLTKPPANYDWPNPAQGVRARSLITWTDFFNPGEVVPPEDIEHEILIVEPLSQPGQQASRHPSIVNSPQRVG